ncbi:TIGR03862 family flavoprotein [Methylocapsa polymorpha]|uniref:TIGR03862 family flavoprotein n=1 Tax=Methylocapsa polymorpha TaxID=3080828 RepID=A0ABZ0HT62_9HYPH|nr:TIGR03862 family flavoprotein [Methylocapsa sp. RX1]
MLGARPHVAVIGAGPAGLMAAEVIARGGATVAVYDRMAAPGRKLLLAGRGGLNITHSENIEDLLARYGPAAPRLRRAIEDFSPDALRAWCESLGQTTFVGSSGRVFPTAFKASPLLRAWLGRLKSMGVAFEFRRLWTGWADDGSLLFAGPDGGVRVGADAAVLALGGASWPRFGSDGGWTEAMANAGIAVAALRPANCGFVADWSEFFRDRFEGQPLKNIELSFGGRVARGEALITRSGLEGGGVYALSAPLREAIAETGEAIVHIAFRPALDLATLEQRIAARGPKQSVSTFLRKAIHLSPAAIGLIHEVAGQGPERLSAMAPLRLAQLINAAPVRLIGVAPIARAISTAGGITFDEIDESFMLSRRPGVFVAGEMLDWEAPTGGYLLQACFATGAAAGRGVLDWLGSPALSPDKAYSKTS